MKYFFNLLIIFVIIINYVTAERKKIVCTYQTSSHSRNSDGNFQVANIQPDLCTHIIYAYLGIEKNTGEIISKDNEFDITEDNINKFNNLKNINTNLKTLIGIGGWNDESIKYSMMASTSAKRKKFIQSSVNWIKENEFDGLLLYWCYPGEGGNQFIDKENFATLLEELQIEYKRHNFILSVMVHGLIEKTSISYNIERIGKAVDFIYLTGLDLYGHWSPTIGLHSALYSNGKLPGKSSNVDEIVTYWIEKGAPLEKLVLGVPFFGRTFTLKYNNSTEPGALHIGAGAAGKHSTAPGILGYNEFCVNQLTEKWTLKWDSIQKVPYAYKDNQWISYENSLSIEEKTKYVNEKQLGGIGASFIEDDDFKGVCGEAYPLLRKMNSILRTAESDFDFIINLSIFKKTTNHAKDKYTQLLYHSSEKFHLSPN